MDVILVDNPKKAAISQRFIAGGIGLLAGAILGYVLFEKNKKEMVINSLIIGSSAFALTYILYPPKHFVHSQK